MKACLRTLAAVVACTFTLLVGGFAMSLLKVITGFEFHHLGAFLGTVAVWAYAIFLLWSVCKVWRLVKGETIPSAAVAIQAKESANLEAPNVIEDDDEMLEITDANGEVMRLPKNTMTFGSSRIANVMINADPADANKSETPHQKAALPTKSQVAKGRKFPAILAGSAVWCMVLALAEFNDQWIYDLSKWALCAGCLYQGYQFWHAGMRRAILPLGILAIIFNPIAPIHFEESEWVVVDWIAAVIFVAYLPGALRFLIKLPSILWRAFVRLPEEDLISWLAVRVIVVFGVFAGAVIGVSKIRDSTPAGRIRVAQEKAGLAALKERAEAQKKAQVDRWKNPPRILEKPIKYPRALPGGGLDWTGVEGGERPIINNEWHPTSGVIHSVETEEEFHNPTK